MVVRTPVSPRREGEVVHCPLEAWTWGERMPLFHCIYSPKWGYLGPNAVLKGVLQDSDHSELRIILICKTEIK